MKNKRKTLTALGVVSAVTGAGALLTTGLLLSLHSSYKVPRHQTYFFLELKKEVEKNQRALESLSISENNQNNTNEIKNLFSEIDYARQLLSNEDSSIPIMLKQRNILKQLGLKAMLSVIKEKTEQEKIINEYYQLVKEVDFLNIAKEVKNQALVSLSNTAINKFFNDIDPLIKKQNEFSFALETKLWTDYDKILKNNSETLTAEQKSTLDSAIEEILNLLGQSWYSKDALLEYGKVYDSVIKSISINKAPENKNLKAFLDNVIHIRKEIDLLKVKEQVKRDFLTRIDNYKKLALSPSPKLAITKAQEILYLNDLVNNQLDTITKIQDENNLQNAQILNQKIQDLESLDVNTNLKSLVTAQVELIKKDFSQHPQNIFNNISAATNLKTAIDNIENLIKKIKEKITDYLTNLNISSDEANSFNTQLSEIVKEKHNNINDYLEKLNNLYNRIYDNNLLNTTFKSSLKTLREQVKLSLDKGFEVDKNALVKINSKINELVDGASALKDLNDGLRTLSNDLRNSNRDELRNLYNTTVSLLSGESLVAEEIKQRLKDLNSKSKPLIEPSSTAIRDDLQFLIGEYKKELQRANVNGELQKTLFKHSQVRSQIEKVFGGPEQILKSPFGRKLLEHADDLKKQAEILSLDPNPELTEKDKSKKLFDIREQLQNLQNNAQNFKDLEVAVANGNTALESSKGRTAEQVALEKEALLIKQLQDAAFESLNKAPQTKDVSDILTKLEDAIKDYKQKQASYQSTKDLDKKFEEINNVFAPYETNGKKTQTQENLIDKLKDYSKQLSNPNLSNEEREKVHTEINHLISVVSSFKDLEANNNSLKALVKDTEFLDFGTFKPDQEYANSKTLNNEIDAYLVSAFKAPFNRNEIKDKIEKIKSQTNNLSLAISVAFLRKINDELQAHKITNNALLNTSPYQEINNSIESLNVKTDELIAQNDKTSDQVNELTNKLSKYKYLVIALEKSGQKLATIDQTQFSLSYQKLLESIIGIPPLVGANQPQNTLVNLDDSSFVIDSKTSILNEELAKVETRMKVESALTNLKTVYGSNEANQAIFDDAINKWEKQIRSFTAQLQDFYANKTKLALLRDEIVFYANNQEKLKNEIQKQYQDTLNEKNSQLSKYDSRAEKINLRIHAKLDAVFDEFDNLVNATNANGKKTTTIKALRAKFDELPLAFIKDLLIKRVEALKNKINNDTFYFNHHSTELKNAYSNKWRDILNNWINAINDTAQSYTSSEDVIKINGDIAKIAYLDNLATVLNDTFRSLDTIYPESSQKEFKLLQTQNPNNILFKKLLNTNVYENADVSTLYNFSTTSMIVLQNEIRSAYVEVTTLGNLKLIQVPTISVARSSFIADLVRGDSYDPNFETQFNHKIDELINQTNNATNKNTIIDADNKFYQLLEKEDSLSKLARRAYQAKYLVRANLDAPEAGKVSIANSIQSIYDSFKDNYFELSIQEIITKDQELEEKGVLLEKFSEVYAQVEQAKDQIPTNYPDGTGTKGTGEDGRQKMEAYYDFLLNNLNTEPITQSKLFTITQTLASLEKLITLHQEKIITQTSVKDDSDYTSFTYKTGESTTYGFEDDANKLADDILESIPDTTKNASNIDNELYPKLSDNFKINYQLYLDKKQALDLIYKQAQGSDPKGIKVEQIEKITDQNGSVDTMYQQLQDKGDYFFHTQATSIQNATSNSEINQAIQAVSETNFFFDKYKMIAELIAKAKAAKDLITNVPQNVQQNQNVMQSLTKLEAEITKGEGYYYTEKDQVKLDNNIFLLKTYVERLNLATEVAQALEKLNNFNTDPNQGEYLSDQAKAPLRAIINMPFTLLNGNTNLENEEEYKRLLQTYVLSSNPQSFNVAFLNSIELQSKIQKAQEYLDSYNAQKTQNQDYEPQNIRDLYASTNAQAVTLESKIAQATSILNAMNHDEVAKVQVASQIFNSNDGILDLIFHAEKEKIEQVYKRNLALKKFMTGAYNNATQGQKQSPIIDDYEAIALEAIQDIDIATPEKLVQLNTKYLQANDKYYEQVLAVYKWEAYRYKSYKEKIQPYTNLFTNATTDNAKKEFILKVTGIDENVVTGLMEKLNPTSVDSSYKKAKESSDHINDDDDAIGAWLKEAQTVPNLVVEQLHDVGSEFLDYFQNLISITSVPLLGLTFSQFKDINEQLLVAKDTQSVGYALQLFGKLSEIQAKSSIFKKTITTNIDPNLHTQLQIGINEQGLTFEQETPAMYTNPRNNFFNKYKELATKLAIAKENLNSFVFGDSPTDNINLKSILHKFIVGENNYDGRANLDNLLKYIADPSQLNVTGVNDRFAVVKDEYNKIATPATQAETLVANLNKATSSDLDIHDAITKGFSKASILYDWMTDSNNTDLFFEYLGEVSSGILNYADILPKDSTFIKNFEDYIQGKNVLETTIRINQTDYDAKLLNQQFLRTNVNSFIGGLFEKFNVLKNDSFTFNQDNVEVYAYKEKAQNNQVTQYITQKPTNDSTIRRGYINLYFKFKKPSQLNETNSAFASIEDFGVKFENVGINFKTLDRFIIQAGNIQNENSLNAPLFRVSDAGWNNLQAPYHLSSAFVKYSSLKARKDQSNNDFFVEKVDEPLFGTDRVSSFASGPDFRVKVKLGGQYKGYTQVGDTIYWKTLTPYVASDEDLLYQKNNLEYQRGILADSDNMTHNWRDKYQYLTPDQGQGQSTSIDQFKNLAFLPLVIGIPVRNVAGEDALLVLSWQILNRFSYDKLDLSEPVSLGTNDKLRYAYFFKPSAVGKVQWGVPGSNTVIQTQEFYSHVMNKIKYRDLVGLTFTDLTKSGLWGTDNLIELDNTNSGKGGIGYPDFYQAINTVTGRFEIQFKLH
ncbi:hypothetical protein NPA08_03705 [Mycoplasmopsis citelli]|uniref:hypothetical protein n=1 Tax=Mycoplasmopsis citelli TaxID=171281 RepID=UPI002114316C|nr:hypothetical protein [Mycoplasmopsis citelli]UUD36032.1 hypothetical protein NPA08_03705 [Mycoplasmopsis citelli]